MSSNKLIQRKLNNMPYPEELVAPMRQEAVTAGCQELRTGEEVDTAVAQEGTSLFFINSVCGCAAGMARPGLAHALHTADVKPDNAYTVFAGNDVEADRFCLDDHQSISASNLNSPSIGCVQFSILAFPFYQHLL